MVSDLTVDDQELLRALRHAGDVIARSMVPVEDATDAPGAARYRDLVNKEVVVPVDRALGGVQRMIDLMMKHGVP